MLGVLVAIDRASTADEPETTGAPEISVRARMPQPITSEAEDGPLELEPQAEIEPEPEVETADTPDTQPEPGPVVVKPRVRLRVGEA